MGVLIWHDWASLLALTSGCYAIWAGIWGILYRKYFWDFVGGTLGPHGLIPPPSAAFFVAIIVKAPILQVLNITNGLLTLAWEWPLPFVRDTALHRSLVARIVFYIWCGFIAFLPYQTIDAGLYYGITALAFGRAISKGEVMAVKKELTGHNAV